MDVMKKIICWLFLLILCLKAAYAFENGLGEGKQEMPLWVANPIADSSDYIYGVGEGVSLAKAEQSALSNIGGKLATVVSSNISSETTLDQGRVNSYFSEQVKTKTFDTKLSGFELVQSASHDNRYYAMVRMSRSTFVKDTLGRLKLIDERLNNRVTNASKVSRMQVKCQECNIILH
jgi:LPP20 lipoprotein